MWCANILGYAVSTFAFIKAYLFPTNSDDWWVLKSMLTGWSRLVLYWWMWTSFAYVFVILQQIHRQHLLWLHDGHWIQPTHWQVVWLQAVLQWPSRHRCLDSYKSILHGQATGTLWPRDKLHDPCERPAGGMTLFKQCQPVYSLHTCSLQCSQSLSWWLSWIVQGGFECRDCICESKRKDTIVRADQRLWRVSIITGKLYIFLTGHLCVGFLLEWGLVPEDHWYMPWPLWMVSGLGWLCVAALPLHTAGNTHNPAKHGVMMMWNDIFSDP